MRRLYHPCPCSVGDLFVGLREVAFGVQDEKSVASAVLVQQLGKLTRKEVSSYHWLIKQFTLQYFFITVLLVFFPLLYAFSVLCLCLFLSSVFLFV